MMRSVCVYRAFRSRMFWTEASEVRPRVRAVRDRRPRRNLRKYAASAATRTPPPARRGPAARAPHGLFPRRSELAKRGERVPRASFPRIPAAAGRGPRSTRATNDERTHVSEIDGRLQYRISTSLMTHYQH